MEKIALSALLSLALGYGLGFVYGVFSLVRATLGIKKENPFKKRGVAPYISWVLTSLFDLGFMLVAAFCTACFFFLTGDGRMRGYGLLGELLGFEIYRITLGRLLWRLFGAVGKRIIAYARKIVQAFLGTPIVIRIHCWYNNYRKKKISAAFHKKRKKAMKNGIKNKI